jgi:hypothetical protein
MTNWLQPEGHAPNPRQQVAVAAPGHTLRFEALNPAEVHAIRALDGTDLRDTDGPELILPVGFASADLNGAEQAAASMDYRYLPVVGEPASRPQS